MKSVSVTPAFAGASLLTVGLVESDPAGAVVGFGLIVLATGVQHLEEKS